MVDLKKICDKAVEAALETEKFIIKESEISTSAGQRLKDCMIWFRMSIKAPRRFWWKS